MRSSDFIWNEFIYGGQYIRAVQQFVKHTEKKLDDITQEDLDRYKVYTKGMYESNSLAPKLCAVNAFMKFLKRPYKLSAPKKIVKNKNPLTLEEVERIFEAAAYEPRDHALLSTLYYTQLRRSEIMNLNLDDIDWERQKIRVNKGKGDNYSTINIHPDALSALRRYLQVRRQPKKEHEEALFVTKYGTRMRSTAIAYTVKKYAARAQIKKRVYPHLFRISSITHMAQNGAMMAEIQKQSRHKDLKTLMGYIQLSDQHIQDVYMTTLPSFNGQRLHRGRPQRDEEKPEASTEVRIPRDRTENMEASHPIGNQLILKLLNGEISDEAFLNAVNILKESKDQAQSLNGYQ